MSIRLLPVGFILAIASCSNRTNMTDYRAAHLSAKQSLPIAVQMEELFGDADHFISHFGFSGEKTNTWSTQVFFDGRYKLTMQVEIVIDYAKNTFVVSDDYKFYLIEVKQLTEHDGKVNGAKLGENYRFSAEDWAKVYESEGDFSVIGIQLRTDDPLPRFDEYVQGWRRPRIPISLRDQKAAPKRHQARKKQDEVEADCN